MEEKNVLQEVVNELKSGDYNGIPQIAELCMDRLNLESDQANELAQLIINEINQNNFPALTNLELLLTSDCVLRCDYCFGQIGEEEKRVEKMSWETAKEAVDFLIASSGSKEELSILFFGGEPLMEFELLRQVVLYAREEVGRLGKKIYFNLTTNGVLINEEVLDFFQKQGIRFLLSLDGNQAAHDRHRKFATGQGSYELLMQKLPLMKKYQPWLGVRMTISPDIVELMAESFETLIEEGVNQFIIAPIDGIEWEQEYLDQFYQQLRICYEIYQEKKQAGCQLRVSNFDSYLDDDFTKKATKWGCRAGRHTISVDATGEIYPCSKMISPMELREKSRLGSLKTGIENLGLRMRFCDYISGLRSQCLQCAMRTTCTGGCYANNFWATGDMFQPSKNEVCRLVETSFQFYRENFLE